MDSTSEPQKGVIVNIDEKTRKLLYVRLLAAAIYLATLES